MKNNKKVILWIGVVLLIACVSAFGAWAYSAERIAGISQMYAASVPNYLFGGLVKLIESEIKDKDVLEVACGGAEFSASASRLARCVHCIDLDASRLGDLSSLENVYFSIMDATKMEFPDCRFAYMRKTIENGKAELY